MAHLKERIFVSQQKYVANHLKETRMLRCKSVDTPIELNHKLSNADKDAIIDQERYQRLDSKLIYPLHTWLDIDNAISVAS